MMSLALRYREQLVAALAASSWAAPAIAAAQGTVIDTSGARGETAAAAIDGPSGIPTQFDTFEEVIVSVFNIVIIVAGIAFVVLLLLGGIQYLAAAGNEDTTKKARQLMLDAVIGLVIVVTAWAIGTYVLSLLGLNAETGASTLPTRVE